MIITILSDLLFLFIGFWVGSNRYQTDIKKIKRHSHNLKRVIHHLATGPSGVVYRPSVDRLNKIKRDRLKTGEVEALEDTFNDIPELKKAKDLQQKYGN